MIGIILIVMGAMYFYIGLTNRYQSRLLYIANVFGGIVVMILGLCGLICEIRGG